MTPVQATAIAVALDGLRESGFDEATLARMQRAVDPNYARDLCLRVGMSVRMLARQIVETSSFADEASDLIDRIDVAAQTDLRLSPAETPAAASVRRPEVARPAVMDGLGSSCRRCLADGFDRCYCEFPGAGAG